MGGIPVKSHIPEEQKPVSSNSSEYSKENKSESPILATFSEHKRGNGYRFIHKDGSTSYLGASQYEVALKKEYSKSILEVEELDWVRERFNQIVSQDKGYNGLLLLRPNKTSVIQISRIPFQKARNDSRVIDEILNGSRSPYLAPTGNEIASYDPSSFPDDEVLIRKNEYVYHTYSNMIGSVNWAIYQSYYSLLLRVKEEMDGMKSEFDEYMDSYSRYFEWLAFSGDMDDSDMKDTLNKTFSKYFLINRAFPKLSSYEKAIQFEPFNITIEEFIKELRQTRYELNKILVADDTSGWHALVMAYEVIGSAGGTYVASYTGPAAAPVSAAFGAIVMGTGEELHQMINYNSYQDLGLDFEESPYDINKVYFSAAIGGALGFLGPVASWAKETPLGRAILSRITSNVTDPLIQQITKLALIGSESNVSAINRVANALLKKIIPGYEGTISKAVLAEQVDKAVIESQLKMFDATTARGAREVFNQFIKENTGKIAALKSSIKEAERIIAQMEKEIAIKNKQISQAFLEEEFQEAVSGILKQGTISYEKFLVEVIERGSSQESGKAISKVAILLKEKMLCQSQMAEALKSITTAEKTIASYDYLLTMAPKILSTRGKSLFYKDVIYDMRHDFLAEGFAMEGGMFFKKPLIQFGKKYGSSLGLNTAKDQFKKPNIEEEEE